jgi:hypothetical protein
MRSAPLVRQGKLGAVDVVPLLEFRLAQLVIGIIPRAVVLLT